MSKLIKINLLLFLLLVSSISYAVIVPALYSAKIPVVSQSTRLRNQQLPKAFESVLIKVSGRSDVSTNETVKNAIQHASQFLKEYSYADNNNDLSNPYILQVSFAQQGVDSVLQQAGFPIWSNNRPLSLIWLVVKDNSGLHFANDSAASETFDQIKLQSQQLGVPILSPLYDLTDLQQVQPSDVWAPFLQPIQSASQRYRFDELLIVRVDETDPAQIKSHWTLQMNDQSVDWKVDATDLNGVIIQGMSKVMEALSNTYAMVGQNQESGQVTLNVVNITDASVYAKVISYLKGLTGVANVDVKDVSSSQANFILTLTTNLKLLKRTISLSSVLAPNPQADQFDEPDVVHYRYAQ